MFCTLQLQPHLLIMESKPSTSTTTSTTTKQDPMPSPQNTASAKKKSDAKPISSTPNPIPISVVQKYVTDAAAIISSSQAIPLGKNKVLDRLIDNYSIPKTSTSPSGSTSTVTASSVTGDTSTTTTTANPAEASTSQDDRRETASSYENPGYNKSASVLRRRIEKGHPNQAFTLFAPLGMAEDLTKIQFTLCNEIKTELQAVKRISSSHSIY